MKNYGKKKVLRKLNEDQAEYLSKFFQLEPYLYEVKLHFPLSFSPRNSNIPGIIKRLYYDFWLKHKSFAILRLSQSQIRQCQNFKKYEIYYPSIIENTDKKYPTVIFANGTGVKGSSYPALLKHVSSWGFIVMATEEEYSWNRFSCHMCLKFLERINNNKDIEGWETNPFYNKVDLDNIGVSGHSQGGVGVINAITNTTYSKYQDIEKNI